MHPDAEAVFVSEEEIQKKVKELGQQITADYAGRELLAVAVLKGASVFMADLVRQIELPLQLDFIRLSSYGSGTQSSGKVEIKQELSVDVAGKDVLIIEDIIDTGCTLAFFKNYLLAKGCRSVRICVLVDKSECRQADINVDYKGFVVPDKFIVGYGLDYDDRYRNIPYIFILKPEVYSK